MTKPSQKPTKNRNSQSDESATQQRLQKVLAAAGLGSRRDCEELISSGRVEVDRKTISELGSKVDPLKQEIRVDGTVLHRPKRLYFAINKPPGVLSTNFDPSGRMRVIDLLPTDERLFPVGRLDRASEGLILVTNDGELANRVTHPRYGVEKKYHVRVAGAPTDEQLLKLKRGIYIAEGMARVTGVRVRKRYKQSTDLEIVLKEGKNREIRRVLAKVGHKVMELKRVSVGPIRLGDLPVGSWRKLTGAEVQELLDASRSRPRGTRSEEPRPDRPGKPQRTSQHKSEKPGPASPAAERPLPTPSSAPPRIDLATLLRPSTAPVQAMAIVPTSQVPAGPPSIGDVIRYDGDDDDASLPALETTPKKRSRDVNKKYLEDSEPLLPALENPVNDKNRGQRPALDRSRQTSERRDSRGGQVGEERGRGERSREERGPQPAGRKKSRGFKPKSAGASQARGAQSQGRRGRGTPQTTGAKPPQPRAKHKKRRGER